MVFKHKKWMCRFFLLLIIQAFINPQAQMKQNRKVQFVAKTHKQPTIVSQKHEEWRPYMSNQSIHNTNSMRWSNKENMVYCQFLKIHKDKFSDKIIRKQTRVYHMLSKKLRKRTALQFKSHHQKMIKRFGNIDNLITQLYVILTLNESESTTYNQKTSTITLELQNYHKSSQQIAQASFIMLPCNKQLQLGIQPISCQNEQFDNGKWFTDE